MNCERCNGPPRQGFTTCADCGRSVCSACIRRDECLSCVGPFSKVDTKPRTHDEAVASLKALGIYEQCADIFGWTR